MPPKPRPKPPRGPAAAQRPAASAAAPAAAKGAGRGLTVVPPKVANPGIALGRTGGGGRARRPLIVTLAIAVPLLLMFLPTAALFIVGMVPTGVAFIVDRDPEKYAPITVGPLNFAGVMPPAIALWRDGHTIERAMALLTDPLNWLMMFGAASIGWAIYFTVPPAVATFLAHRKETEIKRLKEHQDALTKEWGPEVAAAEAAEPPAAPRKARPKAS